jgi:hypothetical protein
MRRTKSSGIGSPMFSTSRSGRARQLDGHRPTSKSGGLQAQCSRELGQPGSLGTPSPGCLADGTWRANPGLAPLIEDRPASRDDGGASALASRRRRFAGRAEVPQALMRPTPRGGGKKFCDCCSSVVAPGRVGHSREGAPGRVAVFDSSEWAARVDKPAGAVRSALTDLREAGFVEALTVGDLEAHTTNAASYWRLTDAGRAALERRRSG